MRFAPISVPVPPAATITPSTVLPEMTLPEADDVPPTVLLAAATTTPEPTLATAVAAVASVPM